MNFRNLTIAAPLALLLATACDSNEVRGAEGTTLSLMAPANQSLTRGETNDVAIKIDRGDFVGPVAIEFSNLPSGVSVANPGTIPAGDELKNFTLTVGADAALVEGHQVTVTASAKDLRVKQIFEVDVHGS